MSVCFFYICLDYETRNYLKIEMMKRMRMLFIVCLFILSPVGALFGQDLAAAVEVYNAGGMALEVGDYPAAIESFSKALSMLEALPADARGEEGEKMITGSKEIIPQLHLRYGKGLTNAKEFDKAIAELNKAIETGEKYGVADVKAEATELMPQVMLAGATTLLNDGKGAEAVAGFKKVLELEPDNAAAYYRLGAAEASINNEDGAIVAFEKAIEMGDKNAISSIATIYLKKASAAYSAKKMQETFDNAVKADGYAESANSKKLGGISAYQLKKYDDAIKYLEAYIAMSPTASDKNTMIYMIALSYEAKNNTAKACGYFKQIINDPTYKETATYKVGQYKC